MIGLGSQSNFFPSSEYFFINYFFLSGNNNVNDFNQ